MFVDIRPTNLPCIVVGTKFLMSKKTIIFISYSNHILNITNFLKIFKICMNFICTVGLKYLLSHRRSRRNHELSRVVTYADCCRFRAPPSCPS
jgi:hypothetical protein